HAVRREGARHGDRLDRGPTRPARDVRRRRGPRARAARARRGRGAASWLDAPTRLQGGKMPAYNEALIGVRFQRINERLRAIEAQLEALSEKAGIPYDRPGKDLPEDVVQLATEGKELEAVKRYRELTGVDAKEAQKVVAGI